MYRFLHLSISINSACMWLNLQSALFKFSSQAQTEKLQKWPLLHSSRFRPITLLLQFFPISSSKLNLLISQKVKSSGSVLKKLLCFKGCVFSFAQGTQSVLRSMCTAYIETWSLRRFHFSGCVHKNITLHEHVQSILWHIPLNLQEWIKHLFDGLKSILHFTFCLKRRNCWIVNVDQNIRNTIFGENTARLRGIVSPKYLIERDRLKSR